jgi:glycosyltransferase involved in cell wall biosynthesis
MDLQEKPTRVAVVIPSYRVTRHIVDVVKGVLDKVDAIYVIDDKCPDGSGDLVERSAFPSHVKVLRHAVNQGVGGAVVTGYRAALADGCDIVIKMDGDGQMDPANIPALIEPILDMEADYTKGNRFFRIEDLEQMPAARLFGNAVLSFVSKLSSGYWNIMDPTNGFTAIHASALGALQLDKLSRRYFFESDMLFRLNIIRAVVRDVTMTAKYGDEESNLKIGGIIVRFSVLYLRNFCKRFFYSYILRDMNIGSVETLVGGALLSVGVIWGLVNWVAYGKAGAPAPLGTIMVAALCTILGVQFLLAALSFDVSNVPTESLVSRLYKIRRGSRGFTSGRTR